jgi:ribokinase
MIKKILVVGSSNTDMVIQANHLPGPGETVIGSSFFMNPGGKGANQAVAAVRLGGRVSFICKTGNDIFGRQSKILFDEEGIDTSNLFSDPSHPSGVALITVDNNAENCIVVASGANAALSSKDLMKCSKDIEEAAIVLMQLEIPLETVQYVAETAAANGRKVILNPAPACNLPDSLLKNISIITPNETEAEMLSSVKVHNIESAKEAGLIIQSRGVQTVIITMGANGALILHKGSFTHIPGVRVKAVDTTAAGDVFNGALAVAIAEGKEIPEATSFACTAAAISVTRLGAQASAPYKREIESFFTHTH